MHQVGDPGGRLYGSEGRVRCVPARLVPHGIHSHWRCAKRQTEGAEQRVGYAWDARR
jgi:hypothetical protein